MRKLAAIPLAVALAALLVAAPLAFAGDIRLAPAGDERFPHRSFVLTLPPDSGAKAGDVQITENGRPVHELAVEPATDASGGSFGAVLMIDASSSMRGEPIRRAMEAARTFARSRQAEQKLGVVIFNRQSWTALDLTTDGGKIEEVLSKEPELAQQGRIYDGVNIAVGMLEKQRVDVGSVILLSDCATTCPHGTLGEYAGTGTPPGDPNAGARVGKSALLEQANRRGVRVFTVGLRDKDLEASTLEELAAETGGRYTAAGGSDDLERIYSQLGEQLSSEYVARYTSVAGSGSRVKVKVTVDGVGSGIFVYTSPELAAAPIPQTRSPEAGGFWGSGVAMLVVALGAAFLIFFVIYHAATARQRAQGPQERVAEFLARLEPSPEPAAPDDGRRHRELSPVEQRLQAREWWRTFSEELEVGRVPLTPFQVAGLTAFGTFLVAWLLPTLTGIAGMVLFALGVPFVARAICKRQLNKQRVMFGEQLSENLQVIASAMRAGQSFTGALAVAVDDAADPAQTEFRRVVHDEKLGVPLEDALAEIIRRMDNRDLEQVVMVAILQREAGGNTSEVLERVAETIRERAALRRLVRTLTAQGRMARWIVSLLPVGLALFISSSNPGYMEPLFETTTGNVMLILAGVMIVSGSLVIKRIVEIKV